MRISLVSRRYLPEESDNFNLSTGRAVRQVSEEQVLTGDHYVLRSYTDTVFDIAESKGLISHPRRQFFMGHKGDIEARYSTKKGRLPPDMIEERAPLSSLRLISSRVIVWICEAISCLLSSVKRGGLIFPEMIF